MKKDNIEPQENLVASNGLKPYEVVSSISGEVVDKFKYLEGRPKQYRFDAKEGVFNLGGVDKLGRSLTFQPIAWRLFTDNILNMGTKNWVEFFFVDEKNRVSAVLFHGYSVDNVMRVVEDLYYDDLTFADVVLTAIAEKKETTKDEKKATYYIATFSFKLGEAKTTEALKAYAQERKIYRIETLTDIANHKAVFNYYNPFADYEAALPEPTKLNLPEPTNNAPEAIEPQA